MEGIPPGHPGEEGGDSRTGPPRHGRYAIESLATKVFLTDRKSWTGPASGLNFSVAMQVTHGNTRPDVVLQLDGREVAWYDITSAKSLGHIFEKDGSGWRTKPYVAEIAYPQVTAQTVESNAAKWRNAGSPPDITNDPPMIFANYWMERARFEVSMEFMRQDILQNSPPRSSTTPGTRPTASRGT
ncbi:hypothetical protein GTV15_17095 [Streptomyces sp. SID7803]|nr:hypothetical protein [Streptomyces sp. SID7803]